MARPLNRLFLGFAGVLLAALVFFLLKRPSFEGDSLVMIRNAFDLRACIAEGRWTGCREGGQFPLYQVLPSTFLAYLGATQGFVAHFLAYLSFACFLAWFWIFARVLRDRAPTLAPLAALILLSGYGVRYTNSTFGEVFAATLVLGMVASRLLKRPAALTIGLFAASVVTKDTALPFVFGFFALAALARDGFRAWKSDLLIALSGSATGLAAMIAFNFFRYGSALNQVYLTHPEWIVDDPEIQRSFFGALWFSPSGGMAVFWTSFFVALIVALIAAARKPRSFEALATGGVFLGISGLCLGLSRWVAPLGWYSWGPRLLLPWLPASLLILLFAQASAFQSAAHRVARSTGLTALTAGVLAISAFPHFRALLRYQWVNRLIEWPDCPPGVIAHACSAYKLWPPSWPILEMYRPTREPAEWIGAALLCSILVYGVFWYGRRLTGGRRCSPSLSE